MVRIVCPKLCKQPSSVLGQSRGFLVKQHWTIDDGRLADSGITSRRDPVSERIPRNTRVAETSKRHGECFDDEQYPGETKIAIRLILDRVFLWWFYVYSNPGFHPFVIDIRFRIMCWDYATGIWTTKNHSRGGVYPLRGYRKVLIPFAWQQRCPPPYHTCLARIARSIRKRIRDVEVWSSGPVCFGLLPRNSFFMNWDLPWLDCQALANMTKVFRYD